MAFCKLNGIKGDKIRRSRHYQIPEKSQTTESLASSDSSSEKSQKFSGKSLQGNKEKLIVKEASAERQMSKKSEAISLPEFHMVVKGDGLFSIARKYGLEVGKLRSLNPGTGDKLWNGQQIRLRDDAFADSDSANGKKEAGVIHPVASSAVSAQSIKHTANEGTPILYEVQKGDTLYSITRKFNRLSVKELIRINNLKNRQIKPGQQLIVG
jgi:membrane-bound lytic murein transglycosylase D